VSDPQILADRPFGARPSGVAHAPPSQSLAKQPGDAKCELWEKSLAAIFAGPDPEETQRVINFMQRAFGYSITGDCREECCFFAGAGAETGRAP